jgi:Domain of unknown function (DUF5664)
MSNGRQKLDVGNGYPDNNPKTILGVTKPSLSKAPPVAMLYMALAFMDGAYKYGAYNWRSKKVTASIYVDAAMRHLQSWFDGEETDVEGSKLPHLAHALACIAILVDAKENAVLVDDRPPPGAMPRLLKEWAIFLKQQADDRAAAVAPVKRRSKSKRK